MNKDIKNFHFLMGYMNLNDKWDIVEINLTAAEIIGIDQTKALSFNFKEFLLNEDIPKFQQFLDKCKEKLNPYSQELKLISSRWGILHFYLTTVPFILGNKTFYKVIFNDILERNKSDQILVESEKRFRLMADNSPVMIWMTNPENKLEYMNKTKLEFLGKSLNELTDEGWMETRHPDDRQKFLQALFEASREKRNFTIEMRVMDRNGDYRWLLDSAAPRFLDDNTFAGFIGSGVDITEEKNFRTNLQRSLKEKEILLTEIHHRVKNNLQVISSLLSLQAINVEDENVLAMFRTCSDRIRSMAVLHEKLYQSENIHKVNIREYLNDLLSYLLMSYKQSLDINLKLNVVDFEVSIGLCLNMGLILNELVSNALKHAFKDRRQGEILVDVMKTGDDKIRILVKDDGKGIPEDFDIEESKTVGLMLVKTLIDQHKGTMEIIRNGSTEFRIYLQYSEESNIIGPEDEPVSPDAKLPDWVVS